MNPIFLGLTVLLGFSTLCTTRAMEENGKPPLISIALLLAHNQMPCLQDNGMLDLSNLNLESLNGLSKIELQEAIMGLDLSKNLIKELPSSLFTHLVDLDISHNPIEHLPHTMIKGLAHLKRFVAHSTCIKEIPEDFFQDSPGLEDVNFANNQLTTLGPKLLQPLVHLRKLNLARNTITDLHPETLCSQTDLKLLRISHNKLRTLPSPLTQALRNLEILDLNHNEIDDFEPQFFEPMVQLKSLILTGNRLKRLNPQSMRACTQLLHLDIGYNQFESIDPQLIHWFSLRSLNLRGNPEALFENLSDQTKKLMREQSLFIGNPSAGIDSEKPRTTRDLIAELSKTNSLEEIVYEHAFLDDCYVIHIPHRNLTHLDDSLVELVPHPEKVIIIQANNNYLEELPCSVLNKFVNLEEIQLGNNRIKSLTQKMKGKEASCPPYQERLCLENLHTLNLAHNCIEKVSKNDLSQLQALASLHLDYNNIEEIENEAFRKLPGLQYCYLQRNQVRALCPVLFTSNSLTCDQLEFVDLSNNELGPSTLYQFPTTTRVKFEPQKPLPLRLLVAHKILAILEEQNLRERLSSLIITPALAHSMLAMIASRTTRNYLHLGARIATCLREFEEIKEEGTSVTWEETLDWLQKKKWEFEISLFLDKLKNEAAHKRQLKAWCMRKLSEFAPLSLSALARALAQTPYRLIEHCLDVADAHFQLSMKNAQEIYELYLALDWGLRDKNKALLMACRDLETKEQIIYRTEVEWRRKIENFKIIFAQWGSDTKEEFFKLCSPKLKTALANYEVR